jgi:hypothetical protein
MKQIKPTLTGRRYRGFVSPKAAFLLLMVSASGFGMWKYAGPTLIDAVAAGEPAAAPPAVADAAPAQTTTPPPARASALTQCVDANGKLLWTDTICPAGSTTTTLKPDAGTTYSSEDSMRPTRDMPVYIAPPVQVATVEQPDDDATGPEYMGRNGNAARLWRLRHEEAEREVAAAQRQEEPRHHQETSTPRPMHMGNFGPRRLMP